MNMDDHGGNCCGVRHIYGFDSSRPDELTRLLAQVDAMRSVDRASGDAHRLTEVILSERQVTADSGNTGWTAEVREAGGWPAILAANGFSLVNRFENANSGKKCYIFHRVNNPLSLTDLPFDWTGPLGAQRAAPAARTRRQAPPAPVTVVRSLYSNVYPRSGRSTFTHSAIELARGASGDRRVERIDRLDIMSDGTERWVENVDR